MATPHSIQPKSVVHDGEADKEEAERPASAPARRRLRAPASPRCPRAPASHPCRAPAPRATRRRCRQRAIRGPHPTATRRATTCGHAPAKSRSSRIVTGCRRARAATLAIAWRRAWGGGDPSLGCTSSGCGRRWGVCSRRWWENRKRSWRGTDWGYGVLFGKGVGTDTGTIMGNQDNEGKAGTGPPSRQVYAFMDATVAVSVICDWLGPDEATCVRAWGNDRQRGQRSLQGAPTW
ncbi:hypothetical protein FH972_021145 [Carpinus fangiana]|uniref:Uncharacterized protein n=1 Tax=Carpinus fangiana TaxID=176857 RepID=A0A5N6KQM4_9ROSI|nr:hypothetical protein FH972_021145 [Carpinus fangiana]